MKRFDNSIFNAFFLYEQERNRQRGEMSDRRRFALDENGKPSEAVLKVQREQYELSLKVFHPDPDELVEFRAFPDKGRETCFVKDKAAALRLAMDYNPAVPVFHIFNRISPSNGEKAPTNSFVPAMKGACTSDTDIALIRWAFVDVDPVRPSGVSSTLGEKEEALKAVFTLLSWLQEEGFPAPVLCDSGNGYHLYIRCNLPYAKKQAVESFVKAVSGAFTVQGKADIDRCTTNPARLSKLYGTVARKGENTEERPHRQSSFIFCPETPEQVTEQQLIDATRELLQAGMDEAPVPVTATPPAPKAPKQTGSKPFDVESFLNAHGIRVSKQWSKDGIDFRQLDNDPLDPAHTDNVLMQLPSGAVCYHNFHEHANGSSLTWRDFRLALDPAYTAKQSTGYSDGRISRDDAISAEDRHTAPSTTTGTAAPPAAVPEPEPFTWEQIENPPAMPPVLIDGLLYAGQKMLISGASKAGKSFLLIELALMLSTGRSWLDMPCRKSRVLYLNTEINAAEFDNRVSTVYKALRMDKSSAAPDLVRWNLCGYAQPVTECREQIISAIRKHGCEVLIIDPVYKVFDGDENDNRAVRAFSSALDFIRAETGCSIIYCHHHSKGNQAGRNAIDRSSGSGVFARDAETIADLIELAAPEDDAETVAADGYKTAFRMEFSCRSFPKPRPLNIWFRYPLHFVDFTGTLDNALPKGTGWENLQKAPQRQTKNDDRLQQLIKAFDAVSEDGKKCRTSAMVLALGRSDKTLTDWLQRFPDYFRTERGTVYRLQTSV